ncbi:MAG: primosomal protein N' [Planctomycetes bacterium]|nr:primosomal protein N' [Planctomycetota bacterium]
MTSRQQTLFDTSPAPWELDAAEDQLVASVVFPSGAKEPFDYLVPMALRGGLTVGARVLVPFGRSNRALLAYCVGLADHSKSSHRLKNIKSVVDARSLLSPAMLRMTEWIADHYLCPWGQVLESVLPAGVRSGAGTREATLLSVPTEVAMRMTELKLPPRQHEILRHLAGCRDAITTKELAVAVGCTEGPIRALRQKGFIEERRQRISNLARADTPEEREPALKLNPDQQAALATIDTALESGQHRTLLIHGVTGSGKTEVYIRAIEKVVSFGRQAIVLVPEISLTPQTRQRFRSRFDQVAVLHSHLTDAERHWQWQRIAAGEVQVVVGARSAIFAPTPALGLIVLDEEHESSFKQSTAPRYHARDVALFRARAEDVPLVLGTATPSLESWHRAKTGKYELIDMPRRVMDRPLPEVVTVDLRTQTRGGRGAISRPLRIAMEEALSAGGQVMLLLNRRGFSTHIQCPACGEAVRCADCDVALTHHRENEQAVCHYCDFHGPAPQSCPSCGRDGIRYGGLGTQRLEAEIRAGFPDHVCLRMDTDSMKRRGSHEDALGKFKRGEVDILLGTQMIAKGLDFPNVTLVGVINADVGLHMPDFRAAERTFQLVTQVAGRTGRGPKGGRVIVQTFSPDHPAIQAAVRHDMTMFATAELPHREALQYPPCGSLIRLIIRGPQEAAVKQFAGQLTAGIGHALGDDAAAGKILGPAPAPITKLRGNFRYQAQLHGPNADVLRGAVRQAAADLKPPEGVQWIADVDPLEML